MTIVHTVTKNVLHRAWTDLEPKVVTFLATGLSAGVIVEAAGYLGYPINPGLAIVLSTVIASVFGYVKSSTSKVVTPVTPVAITPAIPPVVPVAVPPVETPVAPVA
jgi:hypothetical protein